MKKTVLVFGGLILALLLLFKISELTYLSGDLRLEFILSGIALLFFFVGIYINKKTLRKQEQASIEIDFKRIKKLEISEREYEVLQKISEGLSNKEIAEQLFVSESTVKTHVSSLLLKLNAKRRTQAIQIAKSIQIL